MGPAAGPASTDPAGPTLTPVLGAPPPTTAPAAPPATAVPPTATAVPPTATAVPPTATAVPPTATPAPRALTGHVLDAFTGHPVAGAQVQAAGATTTSGTDGAFDLGLVPPGTALQAGAPGYAPATLDSGSTASLDVPLRPTTLQGRVTDAATGKPLAGVIVRLDRPTAGPPPALTPALPPSPLTPAPGLPTPFADSTMILAVTGADGTYRMADVPANGHLTFKLPGYKLTHVQVGRTATQDLALAPFVVKALYLTASAATYAPLYQPIMDLADKSEINAIVLNIQDDKAHVVYDTKVPLAVDSGAVNRILPNIKDVIADLHKHNLYVIGRMVTFMQPAVADANPNLAVRSKATGKPWEGGYQAQQRWLDPTNPAARQYPIALAREAVDLGFDEIQFDYIRFPSDPAPGETWDDMSFSQPADETTKPQYIQQFMAEAHNMLNPTDAFMSVDIFGYTVWPDQNGLPLNASIGQVFERMVVQTDYISPMIYPSHFSSGELGFSDPNAHPYEIIKEAGTYTATRIQGQRAKYRPWLQGFDWNHLAYDGHLYRLQKQAAMETGAAGWMFWDPSNIYSADGFDPKP